MQALLKISLLILPVLMLSGCLHEEETETITITALACNSTSADSSFNGTDVVRIHSETATNNTYEQVTLTRGATMDYMVHNHANPQALIVLIAGGQLNANLTGTPGSQALTASGNFLVRSAHLFAAQGYKVVTIDRPSDWADFVNPAGSGSGSAFDGYRTSNEHYTDIQTVITAENASPALPVVIAGTSRGAISAVAQHNLGDYVLLSAPVTGGNNGSPVGTTGVLPSQLGSKPVHLSWHQSDGCFVSTPAGAGNIAGQFDNVTAVEVSGGLNYPELSGRVNNKECDGSKTYHGFLAIESCVVQDSTSWLDAQLNP
ncbi:MAG: hypothetical protein OEY29_16025 [Gammaproteobacteria bacterium]|nr:hypothetical protein [Gammaproteobacteria bacterium]